MVPIQYSKIRVFLAFLSTQYPYIHPYDHFSSTRVPLWGILFQCSILLFTRFQYWGTLTMDGFPVLYTLNSLNFDDFGSLSWGLLFNTPSFLDFQSCVSYLSKYFYNLLHCITAFGKINNGFLKVLPPTKSTAAYPPWKPLNEYWWVPL